MDGFEAGLKPLEDFVRVQYWFCFAVTRADCMQRLCEVQTTIEHTSCCMQCL